MYRAVLKFRGHFEYVSDSSLTKLASRGCLHAWHVVMLTFQVRLEICVSPTAEFEHIAPSFQEEWTSRI